MKLKFKHSQKIRCIDDSKQKVLKVGEIYTVDTTFNAPDNRVYIKEWKRFSFSMSRFELVEEGVIRCIKIYNYQQIF